MFAVDANIWTLRRHYVLPIICEGTVTLISGETRVRMGCLLATLMQSCGVSEDGSTRDAGSWRRRYSWTVGILHNSVSPSGERCDLRQSMSLLVQ